MYSQEQEKVVALAGVCQAAALVQHIARTGGAEDQDFEASINSIIVTDPDNTVSVFGGISGIQLGLKTLISQLDNSQNNKNAEITRYIASILGLERKLSGNRNVMNELGERINQIKRQTQHLDLFDHQMINNLASVYGDVISPAGPKIQVAGNPAHLKQMANQHKVRALLLAGVRAAVLWRQLGGKRRHILFTRRKILSTAQALLR
ncbi:high frequency lysogenization protein HflD [Aestuariibacter sp. AA17]|uniref:High frequency lysogenization protein HflD homolog n=1 Tax=Fluctibacter corallii TaxID=2984329 RepID=A0ABT3A6P1_9ALTE|nr:high frequency lysogenization protein HflD [Aestuariibacter sp. AA17]MCV2883957.1 high frequency lysogenization protein HflD [Aestuariibacter sp. AA17]